MNKRLLTAVAILACSTQAFAAPVAASAKSGDFKAGDWMIRARALQVAPDESSSMSISDEVKVANSLTPEVDFTYFFTPNISAELIAAVTKQSVSTKGGVNAGSAWLLPPTLTLQYHFNQLQSVKPYVGAGVNYTHFYDADGGALHHVSYDDSFGGALQAGVDVPIQGNWYFNADVKKVFIHTTAKFEPSNIRANVDIDPWLIGAGIGYKF